MTKREKSAGKKMVEAAAKSGRVKFTPAAPREHVSAPVATNASRGDAEFAWTETKAGQQWTTMQIPKGECCTPRITISSKDSRGQRVYFCYRDARAVGIKKTLAEAKKCCEDGYKPEDDAVRVYALQHPGEIPPFLALTDEERSAVRKFYPAAAPRSSAVNRMVERGAQDPGTIKLLAELRARESAAGSGQRSTRAAKKDALADPSARLLAVPGIANPAKEGTKRHAGYKLLLDCAARGATVSEYLGAGGKDLRLAKAVRNGLVELKKGGK